jgi:hypothetical protein
VIEIQQGKSIVTGWMLILYVVLLAMAVWGLWYFTR